MRPTPDVGPSVSTVRFGPYQFDTRTGELYREDLRLKISGQAIEVLRILVSRPGEMVTREELQRRLWPEEEFGDFEHGLNAAVNRLRENLLDSVTEPKYIETIPRHGYRFIGLQHSHAEAAAASQHSVLAFPGAESKAEPIREVADPPASTSAKTLFASRRFVFVCFFAGVAILAAWLWKGSPGPWLSRWIPAGWTTHQPRAASSLSSSEVSRGTTNPAAYESFLQARYFYYMLDQQSYQIAKRHVDEAIRLDPKFAAAYALRGRMLLQFGGYTWMNSEEAKKAARLDAVKALELDPRSPEAYLLLSVTEMQTSLCCRKAFGTLQSALQLAPENPDILHQGALLAMCLGRPNDAIALLQRELQIDPLRSIEYVTMSQMHLANGRNAEAEEAIRQALNLNPNGIMIHETWGEILLAEGRGQAALDEMRLEPAGIYHDLGLALAFHAIGQKDKSEVALQRLIFHHGAEGAYQIAQVYAYQGKIDEAFAWLERARTQSDAGLMWLRTDFKMNALRKDPRYPDLLRRLDLVD